MKRLLLVLLCFATLAAAKAQEFVIGDLKYTVTSENEVSVAAKDRNISGDISIPEYVMNESVTYSVTTIGMRAFEGCGNIMSTDIPNTVIKIQDAAFSDCYALRSVNIPTSVTMIGNEAFFCCRSLISINIPNSVNWIGRATFADCSNLTSVIIPNSVKMLGDAVFAACNSLTSIEIPNSVNSIGERAFADCVNLIYLYIDSPTPPSLEYSSLENCNGNLTIFVPSSAVKAYREAPVWQGYHIVGGACVANNAQSEILSYSTNTLSGIQFDVEVPDGVELAVCDEAAALMTISTSEIDGGKTRYVAYTRNGEALPVEFMLTATAGNATRGTMKISNIILSVDDKPVCKPDFEIPVLGYSLSGIMAVEVEVGTIVKLPTPTSLNYDGITVSWVPFENEIADLSENGYLVAKAEATLDLGLKISDPIVDYPLDATVRVVMSLLRGDADNSGVIDIADVVAVVNFILLRNPDPFNPWKADVDGSGDINIVDVTRLVKLVLAQPHANPVSPQMRIAAMAGEITLKALASDITSDHLPHLYISLDTNREYTAMQLDLELTHGVQIQSVTVGNGASAHVLDYAAVDENTTRMVVYSADLAPLPAGEHIIDVTLAESTITEESTVGVTSITADADARGYEHSLLGANLYSMFMSTAGVEADAIRIFTEAGMIIATAPEASQVSVYDLQGRKLGTWNGSGSLNVERGVYIVTVDGRRPQKVEVK